MKRTIALVAIAALILLSAAAFAEVYDFAYEGNVIPDESPGAPTTGWVVNDPPGPTSVATDGDVLTVTFDAITNNDADWVYRWLPFNNSADTWTVDYRIGRPTNGYGNGHAFNKPCMLNFGVSGDGTAGNISIMLGRQGSGGMGGYGDPTPFDDRSILTVEALISGVTSTTEVDVPGLNVELMNAYRVVGTGGGNFKIYVNGIAAPVYSGTFNGSDPFNGNFSIRDIFYANNTYTVQSMTIDYIRLNNSVAYDTAPVAAVPEPGSLLALCSGLMGFAAMTMRRR